jgi:glycosyltransferase involved in cell wall biosynthesis
MNIAVCALTYRREDGLRRLLEGMARQELPEPAPALRVIVVDNDPERGARELCHDLAAALPWPLEYHHEARAGIAFARNRAVRAARPWATWIASIDDDEIPDPRWLYHLIGTQRRTGAPIVAGPVMPCLPEDAPAWSRRFGFYERPNHEDGAAITRAFTHNVLYRVSLLGEDPEPFPERYALMGCEDAWLFRRLHASGHEIRWARGAVVREWLPPERLRPRWLVGRAFRVGATTAQVERDLHPGLARRLGLLARAAWWKWRAALRLPLALVAGKAGWIHCCRAAAYSAGLLAGSCGHRHEAYRREP